MIDVAMTETARLAHYVLPASSQFEKYEATYFNSDFPIIRNPDWRKKGRAGALRVNPQDAHALGLSNNDHARLITRRGSAEVTIEVSEMMRHGHLSQPNGLGLDYDAGDGVTPQYTFSSKFRNSSKFRICDNSKRRLVRGL